MSTRVGFIGLGIMGRPMASNLLKAGFHVVAHSRTRSKVDALAAQGAEAGSVAARCGGAQRRGDHHGPRHPGCAGGHARPGRRHRTAPTTGSSPST